MAIINTDTKELYLIGDRLITLSKQLEEQMNKMFKRIDGVPTNTLEWVGFSSNKFVELSKEERSKYYNLIDDIKKYGVFLCDTSESIENSSYIMRNN